MDEKEVSLLGFVRKAAAEARKKGFGRQPARQAQRVLEGWADGSAEAGADAPSQTDELRGANDRYATASNQTAAELGAEPVQPEEAPIEGPAEVVPIVLVESAQPGSSIAKEDDERSFLKLLRDIVAPARAGMVFQDGPRHPPQANDQNAEASPGVTEQTEAEDGHGTSLSRVAPDEPDFQFDNPKAIATPQPPQIEVAANQAQTKDDGSDQVEACVTIEVSSAAAPGPKLSKSARQISELIRDGLRQIDGFPETGIDVTVYGFGREWNVLLTFAPGSTTLARATSYRRAMPELVVELRKQVELGAGDEGPTPHRFG